jgi:lipid-binding SYLF domain-containing protein
MNLYGKERKMGEIPKGRMKARMAMILTILAVAMLFAPNAYASSADENRAQRIVDRAQVTLNDFLRDSKDLKLHANLYHAKGVLIFPEVFQGGLILGGSRGTGVFLVRDEKRGDWSHPAFLTINSISLGLQVGGGVAELVILAMNQEALDSLFFGCYTLGGDASIALGPVGAGVGRSRFVPDLAGKFISLAKSKGLYAGLNLTGALITERESLERAYYGVITWLEDIVLMDRVSNKGAAGLRETLKNGGSR